MKAAGFSPAFSEPDIRFRVGAGDWAVACKHVYSESKVEERLSQARKQIDTQGVPGIVAISLNCVTSLWPPMEELRLSDGSLSTKLRKSIEDFVKGNDAKWKRHIHGPWIIGAKFSLGVPCILNGVLGESFTHVMYPAIDRNDPRMNEFKNLQERRNGSNF